MLRAVIYFTLEDYALISPHVPSLMSSESRKTDSTVLHITTHQGEPEGVTCAI